MSIDGFTTKQLEDELERRKNLENPPEAVDPQSCDPRWSGLISMCKGVIEDIVNGDYHEDNDNSQYIYEAAMKAVFGEDVFKWMNKNT